MNTLRSRFIGYCLAAAWLTPTVAFADIVQEVTIQDEYWGGLVTSSDSSWKLGAIPSATDILANAGYSVDKMDVTRTDTSLKVVIAGDYFKNTSDRFAGDLFLSSTGWHPVDNGTDAANGGAPTYSTDNLASAGGTVWDYVLHIDGLNLSDPSTLVNQTGSTLPSGTISLYKVDGGGSIIKPEDIKYEALDPYTGLPTGEGMTVQGNEGYRQDQAVSYIPVNNQPVLGIGEWTLDPDGTLTFTLTDLNGNTLDDYGLGLYSDLGLHWTMSCANDIIEGQVNAVPEPATMVLFGLGLSGLAAYRLRRKK